MGIKRVTHAFLRNPDVVRLSQQLLGMHLFTMLPAADDANPAGPASPRLTGGIIVETEAYTGVDDRASHAYGNRRTRRTDTLYCAGGVAYVYLCYGIHALFNIVTGARGEPQAILVRALQPTHGIRTMLSRRRRARLDATLTAGPGALTQALGITTALDAADLRGNRVWLEDRYRVQPRNAAIVATPRIGVDYAGEDAHRPLRFFLERNPWVSKR